MSQKNRTIGQRLKEERSRLELTQAQVAGPGGVSKTTQVAYENDQHVPDARYLNNVSSLGIDQIYVLTGQRKREIVKELFDWTLLCEIVEQIFKRAELRDIRIPPAKLITLAQVFYDEFSEADAIDEQRITTVLKLVA